MNAEPGGNLCQDCQGPECGVSRKKRHLTATAHSIHTDAPQEHLTATTHSIHTGAPEEHLTATAHSVHTGAPRNT